MECKGRIIIKKEAIEKMVEEKVLEMRKEFKEDGKKKEKEIKELRVEMESLRKKMYRLEQSTGKRKREESEERKGKINKRKWWTKESEWSDDKKRKKNVIIRVEKERWKGKESNWAKVEELFSEGLNVKVEMREVSVIGQRGDWLTIIVRMGSEEDKWRVLNARRKEGGKLKVKIDEDKPVEMRIRERKEKERIKERREEVGGNAGRSVEDEIARKMEESLLMDTDEDEDSRRKGE